MAPGASAVFIDDAQFVKAWSGTIRYYLLADGKELARLRALVGSDHLHQVAESGGRFLFTNGLSATTADGSNHGKNRPSL